MDFIQLLQKIASLGLFFNLVHLFVIFSTLTIGLITYRKNPANLNNRSFAYLNLNFCIWSLAMYITSFSFIPCDILIRISHFTFALGFIMGIFYFKFALIFPDQNKFRPWYYWPVISLAFAFFVITAETDWVRYYEITNRSLSIYKGHNGFLFIYAFLMYLFLALISSYIIFSKIKKFKGRKKTQTQYVFVGLLLFIIYIFGTDLIPLVFKFKIMTMFGSIGILFFIGFTFYAMAKHRLMDIKLVLLKSIIHLAMIFSLVLAYIFIVLIFKRYLEPAVSPNIIFVFAIFLVAYGFPPVRRFAEEKTEKFFYHGSYDFHELLEKISNVLNNNPIANDLAQELLNALMTEFKAKSSFLTLADKSISTTHRLPPACRQTRRRFASRNDDDLVSNLTKILNDKKSIVYDELENEEESAYLQSLNIEVVVKIPDGSNCYGLLILGEKLNGQAYNSRDLKLLELIAPQITFAFKNAKKQEELVEKIIEERERIAQDAHDKIYNKIGAMAKIAETAALNSAEKPVFKKIETGLRQAVNDLQQIVSGKIKEKENSLNDRLKQACAQHYQTHNQEVTYSSNYSKNANNPDLYWNIECILQECLNNCGKHSKATKIDVNLSQNNASLILSVKDNGVGLKATDIKNLPDIHKGLRGITKRAESFKGKADFNNSNQGLEVVVEISVA